MRGYAAISRPLTLLLKEDTEWSWGPSQQQAFDHLQHNLRSEPVLALPQPDKPYTLYTDFCGDSVGAVLEQLGAD